MSDLPPQTPPTAPDAAPAAAPSAEAARVHAAAAEWRKRSRLIHFFRRALPIAIIGVSGALLLWVVGKSVWSSVTGLKASEGAEIRVTNARFYGQDEQGRSFVLGAQEAVRRSAASQKVALTGPNLRLNSRENKPTQASAARGLYDQRSQRVQLSGGVSVSDVGSGYRFDTERTTIDTRTGVISGDSPVRGAGPLGQISASSYAIYDQGSRMTFKGNVKARINARATR
ncbi:MAG: LPS export ABC transporter periplasmic protein LptC [Caulobacteraceae bacterium]|nr:LPS export ABC transporter periplasmic protein LptC [Caulobacteraceae bacterium]